MSSFFFWFPYRDTNEISFLVCNPSDTQNCIPSDTQNLRFLRENIVFFFIIILIPPLEEGKYKFFLYF